MFIRLSALAFIALLGSAPPAWAQFFPWFNGVGVSAGGGPMALRGSTDDPVVSLVRPPEDSGGAATFGAVLSLGTSRWSLILPEFHAFTPVSFGTDPVEGSLSLGDRTLDFAIDSWSASMFAITVGGQVSPVPGGRVWVRGGVGQGWLSRGLVAKDYDITVSASSKAGLALAGAAGARIWTKELDEGRSMALDLEVHYMRVRLDQLYMQVPSIRLGWSMVLVPLAGTREPTTASIRTRGQH